MAAKIKTSTIQKRMDKFISGAKKQGFKVNKSGEVLHPSPALVAKFNKEFTTSAPKKKKAGKVAQKASKLYKKRKKSR